MIQLVVLDLEVILIIGTLICLKLEYSIDSYGLISISVTNIEIPSRATVHMYVHETHIHVTCIHV